METLCLASTCGHFLLLKVFDMAETSVLQSFAYIGVVTLAVVGFLFFADPVTAAMLTGGGIVIAAGLFTFWRERVQARAAMAARHDSAETSFFWTGIIGATGISLVVPLA